MIHTNHLNLVQNAFAFSFVIPIKPNQNSFILWCTQVLVSIKGNNLEGFINKDHECAEQFFLPKSNNRVSFFNKKMI